MNPEKAYGGRIAALAGKYKQFFEDKSPGQILATICPYTFDIDYSPWGCPDRTLDTWDFLRQIREYAEYTAARQRAFIEYTKDLDNDYVPAVNLGMGYGVHSAYVTGQEVIMGDITSWTHPVENVYEKLDSLNIDENNIWLRTILEGYARLCELFDGDFAVSAFNNAGPGDMANAIRGNDLFYDLYDDPENVHLLMDKCADASIWLEERLRSMSGFVLGGSVTANVWFPGSAPYISEDFNDLCSAEQFREFGAKHTQKILNHFGGAYIHHHARGFQVHSSIAALKNLSMLEISLDPNCERPVDRLPELFEQNGDVPLMIRCHARDVYERIDDLKRGRAVIMLNIDNLDEGREVMRFIRKNSII